MFFFVGIMPRGGFKRSNSGSRGGRGSGSSSQPSPSRPTPSRPNDSIADQRSYDTSQDENDAINLSNDQEMVSSQIQRGSNTTNQTPTHPSLRKEIRLIGIEYVHAFEI